MTARTPSLSERVFSATFWNTLMLPLNLVVGIVTSVLYYQVLSLEQVGLIFLLTSLASTIGLYADLGIERALPRYLPEVERHGGRDAVRRFIRQMLKLKLAILFVLILILNLFADPLVKNMADRQREAVIAAETRLAAIRSENGSAQEIAALEQEIAVDQTLATQIEQRGRWFIGAVSLLLVLGAIFDVYMQFLTAYFKQRAWNLITLVTRLLQPLLIAAFLVLGWGVTGVMIGLVVTPLVSIALAGWQTRRSTSALPIEPSAEGSVPAFRRRFVNFAAVSYLMQVSAWFYDLSCVVFVLSATLGLREVAILSFAYKFDKDYLAYVWTPLSGVITPLLTRIRVERDSAALRDAHASLMRILLLLLVPAGVGLVVLAPYMVAVLYPSYLEATTLIAIFIFFTFDESLFSVPHNIMMVYEHFRVVIASRLVALLSVPLILLLLPRFGLIGVAVAVGLVRLGSRLVTVVYGVRKLDLTLPYAFAGRVAAAATGFAVVLLAILRLWPVNTIQAATPAAKAAAFVPVLGLVLLGAALYAAGLRLLGGLDEAERRRLLTMRLPFKHILARVL